MEFLPESPAKEYEIPFFEDVKSEDGWEGQATKKTIKQLEGEAFEAITRLGGGVTAVQKGVFNDGYRKRDGYRISFVLKRDNGTVDQARLDLAALPCRNPAFRRAGAKTGLTNQEASSRMMLYMLRNALRGMWFMRQIAPGFMPLMPFLLAKDSNGNEITLSELYGAKGMHSNLLPGPKADFIEGEVIEARPRR